MGVMDEINGSYRKRKKTIAESIADGTFKTNFNDLYEDENEKITVTDAIAPTKKTVKKDNWFQSGAFGDDEGNFLTDTLSAAGSTIADIGKGVGKGVFRLGEGVGDAITYGVAGIANVLGNEESADRWKKNAQDDVTEKIFEADNKFNDYVNKNSLLGEKSDNITEGLGYVGGMLATGGAGKILGLGAKGVTALTSGLTFTSSTGSGMTEAYKGGATDEEAVKYGLISGVAEAGTELIFGGLGKTIKAAGLSHGLSQADDILAKKVSGIFQNQIMKNISEYGIKASAEGLEEVASGVIQAVGQKMTYMEEKDIKQLLEDQNLLEQFITGAVVSGIAQAPSLAQSNSAKRDFITGYTQNEQKIYDNEVTNRSNEIKKQRAVETRVNELLESAEKTFGEVTDARKKAIRERVQSRLDNGELDFSTAKLNAKEISKIEEEVKSDLEKGFIDIGTIESTFSNEKTTKIKELQQRLETTKDEAKKQELTKQIKEIGLAKDTELRELLKNDVYLRESYRQEQLKGESFTYETKETDSDITKELVESAKNAEMNDTRKMHDLFDWVNKVSNDKGTKYGFVNNTQLEEMGYYDDLKAAGNEAEKIGGLVRVEEDGTTKVLINVDSDKALNTIIGHETTHLLEGTDEYKLLQDAVKEYGTTKGDYDKRYNAVKKLYEGTNANIENEVTSELVGDYLFTDEQFINSLSVKQPNVFTKVYDYIKHAVKMATAGSKEARQLEQLKYRFEQAYKQNVQTKEATKTNTTTVSNIDDKGRELSKEQATYFKDSKVRDEKGNLLAVYHGTRGDFNVFETKRTGQNYEGDYSSLGRGSYFTSDKNVAKDFGESSVNEGDLNIKETYLDIKNPFYADDMARNDSKILKEISEKYDIKEDDLYNGYNLVRLLRNKGVDSTEVLQGYGYDGIIAEGEYVVFNSNQVKNVDNTKPTASEDIRYSLSDNKGRTLSKRQQEYFKDSKVIDENGNLLEVYHGTGTTIDEFKTEFTGKGNDQYGSGFYFTTEKSEAEMYQSTINTNTPEKIGGTDNPNVIASYLNIQKPIIADGMNLANSNIDLSYEETLEIIKQSPILRDIDETPIGGWFDVWSEGVQDYMIEEVANSYVGNLMSLENDFFSGNATAFREAVYKATGYDGVVHEFENGRKHYIAWFPNQIKSVNNQNPTQENANIFMSLSNNKDVAPTGKYNVYGKDVKVQKAPKEKRTIKAPVKGEVKNDRVPKTNVEEKTTEGNVGTNSELNKQLQKEQNLFRKDFERVVKGTIRDNGFTNKAAKEIYDNIMSKENATTEDIYRAFDGHRQIKIKPDQKYVKEIKDIKGAIRSTPLQISDDVRQMVDFGAFRKSNYGSLQLRKDGIPIDTFYQELSAMYPEHFDSKITHQVDQLIEISNFVKSNTNDVLNQGEIVEITDADLKDVVDTISSALEGKKAFESTLQEMYSETIAPEPQKPIKNASKVESKQITPTAEKVAQNQNMGQVKQRKWTKTSTESDVVDGKVSIEDLKNVTYEVKSNKKTLEKANNKLAVNGYDESLKNFRAKLTDDSIKLEDLVLGERLIQEALNKGDTKTAADLIEDVAILGTELGQMVQALSIIQKLTPEGQLKMLTKVVKRGKTKDKAFANVELTQEMKDKILKTRKKDGSFDQNELTKAVEEVKQKLADQMETTLGDKTNAWRYLSMLGNPKTHIRNVVSNIAMMGTSGVKNIISRTVEDVGLGKAPVGSRTKTWKVASKDVTEYAKQVTTEVKGILTEENGYSENASIKSKRRTFETDILEKIYNFNSDMLTKEDWWFKKSAFNSSFAEFLTANGIKTKEDIANNPKLVEKGKLYAIEQARIATFSQMSYLANKINEIENKNIAGKIVIGSAMPFKKTPINIAKAGLSYSPLGFAKALVDIPKVKSGEMQASQLIDNIAQATTGSALALVGYMLAQAGFLNGGGEDDKEARYDAQLGDMTYSIKIGDTSYSLSWLSPMAMPLFVGANFFETLVEKEEWNTDVVINTLAQTLDPLSEMSFLSGLTDVLSSYETGSMQQIKGMVESIAQNYLGQYIPTLSSQVASAIDDTKRVTTETNASGSKFINTTVNKLKYKIPGLRQTLEPSLDIWGNEVKQEGTVGEKIIDNFRAPYSKKKDITTPVDTELKSIYRETGENSVLPSKSSSYIDYKNEKYNMTNKEFTDFKKKYGQTSFEMLEELFQTNTYAESDSTEKAKLISKVYEYARDVSKKAYFDKHDVSYTNTTEDNIPIYKEKPIKNAIEYDMTPDEYSYYEENPSRYHTIKAITDYETYKTISKDLYDIKGDKDSNDKTISGSRKLKVYDYINGLDLGYEQKLILAKMEYPSEDRYNYEIIDYLNNNNEIDYDTMESILLELGFKVDDYGNIRW